MNIHLPAILMFTRGTRFWPIPISIRECPQFQKHPKIIDGGTYYTKNSLAPTERTVVHLETKSETPSTKHP
jgi:hypothetical protein